jgi:hypothetical protein
LFKGILVVGQVEKNLNHIVHSAHRLKHIVYPRLWRNPDSYLDYVSIVPYVVQKHFQASGFQTDPLLEL